VSTGKFPNAFLEKLLKKKSIHSKNLKNNECLANNYIIIGSILGKECT
jgi:hypothetical protein